MKRRNFLKNLAAAGAVSPLLMNGYGIQAFESDSIFSLTAAADCEDRILVLIQLNGGNDGLNTVIPLDQYSLYQAARSNIAIPENTVLKLTNSTGLHPQMTGLQSLYNQQKVRVIQSVGYPVPNYSHFRSTDIWLTGSDTEEYLNTGWMGRYLDKRFPGFPDNYPNSEMPDPLAIQIGTVLSLGFEGPNANMAMAFTDPTTYYNIVNGSSGSGAQSRAALELQHIRKIGDQLQKFATPVRTAASKATNKSTLYPAAKVNPLADQLKIVAQLIAGGLKTKVYMVSLTGFDTHAQQLVGGDGTPYPHGTLLNQVSVAIQAFMDVCKLLGIDDRVLGMTFSEFGRRIKSNSSAGTDHGAAGPVFLFGNSVIPGILGNNPVIPNGVGPEDNIPMQTDFRSMYASILRQWFCVKPENLKPITVHDFDYDLPLLQGFSVGIDESESIVQSMNVYPNPATTHATISWTSEVPISCIALYDNTGKLLFRPAGFVEPGTHTLTIPLQDLPRGNYFVQWSLPFGKTVSKLLIAM